MGENLWITRRPAARGARAVNSPPGIPLISMHTDNTDAGTSNEVIHNFSSGAQGTLCPTKLFGIIRLFERRPGLSTTACPLYDEC
jgi:hypothetical protein